MGAFDPFEDQPEKNAGQGDQAKQARGSKRRKGAGSEEPERMDSGRGMPQDRPSRGSGVQERPRQRMEDPGQMEPGQDENDWA